VATVYDFVDLLGGHFVSWKNIRASFKAIVVAVDTVLDTVQTTVDNSGSTVNIPVVRVRVKVPGRPVPHRSDEAVGVARQLGRVIGKVRGRRAQPTGESPAGTLSVVVPAGDLDR